MIVSKKYICSLFLILLFGYTAWSQAFKLSGKIINTKNEPLPGATVNISGTNRKVAADVEGRFSFQLEFNKKYTIQVSSAGYATKALDDVEVKADADNTIIIILDNKSSLDEVVVRTSVRRETTSALINLQRNNTAVSSGIAADLIRKTPDRTTGEVLKRVSGASIQDNKFVTIRGLSDRYNAAFINNSQLPSSEPDKKAFSFDVIPANMIDNIVINKTATPELTGEFAGGLIQIQTKDVPTKNFLSVGINLGYNSNSTFNDFISSPRGEYDWLGFDDGKRKLSSAFPVNAQQYRVLSARSGGINKQIEISRLLPNDDYRQVVSSAKPIQSYSLAYGSAKKFRNDASLGIVASLIYRNAMLKYDVDRTFSEQDGTPIFTFKDRQNRYQTSLGALFNITYSQRKNKVSFKNIFNQFFEENYFERTGINNNRLQTANLWSSFLNQRSFYSGQLEGDHQLPVAGIKFRWNTGYSLVTRSQPDLRTSLYVKALNGGGNYEMDPDDTRRFYSNLEDHSVTASGAFTIPFKLFGEIQALKAGGSTLLRFRDFKSRIFRYVPALTSEFNAQKNFLPYDQIFDAANIGRNGFVIDEFTNNEDKYFGISALNSGYLMLDNKLSEIIRLVWGVRVEYFEQFLHTKDRSAKRVVINTETWDILPSANLTYAVNPKNNVRLAVFKTVARPEFREIAPFAFFDYEQNYGISGKPDLKRTEIYNADARYEFYPAGGEVITVGAFYKRFVNPIEFRLDPGSNADRRLYFFQNARNASTYGLELELRKNLTFLDNTNRLLENMSVFGNLTYIFSQVSFADEQSGQSISANRPIQGQSPYLINAGLQYTDRKAFNVTLLYNKIGERLSLVGNGDFPDIYERPRNLFDLQLSKRLLNNNAEIKLTFSDILNQKIYLYENVNKSKTFSSGDRLFSSYTPGTTITVGFTYDFNLGR